jgi:hypothetical protein
MNPLYRYAAAMKTTELLCAVFSVGFAPILYTENTSRAAFICQEFS